MSKQFFRNLVLGFLILFTSLFISSCGSSGSSTITNSGNIVSTVMPKNGSSDVPINSNFSITFTQPINGASLQKSGSVFLSSQVNSSQSKKATPTIKSNQIINLTLQTLSADGRTAVFNLPSGTSMSSNTKYELNLNLGEIKTSYGAIAGSGVLTVSKFSTAISAAPTVVIVAPYDGESNVSLTPSIKIAFNEKVTNVNSSNVSLHKGSADGPNIALGQIIQGNSNVYTFSPLSTLKAGSSYYVVIDSGIVNQDNQSLKTTTSSFTTGDFTSPTAVMIKPSNGAGKVSLTPTIEVAFSESVNKVNANTVSLNEGSPTGPSIAIGGIAPGGSNTYTFSPSEPLKSITVYYVTLNSGIVDNANNPLPVTTFMFTTGSFIVPTVSMVTPSSGENNVTIFNPEIEIKFSSSVSNVNSDNVILHQDSESGPVVAISSITAGPSNTYSFSPSSILNPITNYYLVIGSGIVNAAGNHLVPKTFTFTSSPWAYFGTPDFDEGNAGSYLNMAINSENIPYVAYNDSSYYLSVATNDSVTWSNVGNPSFVSFSGYIPPQISLDSFGNPYIGFQNSNPYEADVMKYSSGSWDFVGGQGSLGTGGYYPAMALDSNNNPYVAFQDCNNNCNATVEKYDSESNTWVTVGLPGFGGGVCGGYMNIALDSDDNPYVAYPNSSDNCNITVEEYNSGNWQQIGEDINSRYEVSDLVIDKQNNIPYLLYQNWSNNGLSVVKYDSSSSNWVPVGADIFQTYSYIYQGQQSLVIDNNGIPYVAFKDYSNTSNNPISVMKYNISSSNWEYVGNSGFSTPGYINDYSLALDNNNVPYVAFIDDNHGLSIMKYFGQ